MPGRVLNFSEFFGKYSSETADEKNLDSFTQSSANFEEGFDDATYDQNPLGPNRPVSSGMEATPAQPGETGAPAFSSQMDVSMNAPEEQEIPEETEEEEFEEAESDEDTEESPETEENDVPEPEAGANPKKEKEKMEESRKFKGLKGFSQFINESYEDEYSNEYDDEFGEEDSDDWDEENEYRYDDRMNYGIDDESRYDDSDDFEEEYGMNPEEDMMDDEFCPNCGTEIGYSPEGASCGCNM